MPARFGRGLQVSAIGLGFMGISQSCGPNPGTRDEMIAAFRRCFDPRHPTSGMSQRDVCFTFPLRSDSGQ